MRRDAHPAHARAQDLITARPAAAFALLALALTIATGALRSPFLLLLPLPALVLLLAVTRPEARWVLGFGTLLLLVGQAAGGELDLLATGALLLGVALLHALTERLRRRLAGTAAPSSDRAAPGSAHSHTPGYLDELQSLLERTRAWTNAVALTVWRGADGIVQPIAAAGRTLPPARTLEGDPLGWVAREGTPLWFAPTPEWSEPGASVSAARLRAEGGEAWLITSEYAPEQGRPAHEDLAAAFAGLRLFIDVRAAQERAQAGQQRIERLLLLLRRIPIEIEAAAFGRELITAAMALTDATGGALATWLDAAGEVVVTAGDDGGPVPGARIAAPTSELALAVRAGAAIERTDGRWRPGNTHVANETDQWVMRPRALTCVPLATPSGIVGVLGLWSSRAPRLDPDAFDLLQTVLPFAALHLEHSREFGRLRDRADRDALTGLLNRRGFEAAFAGERQRFERYGHALALLLLDIDLFKGINDEHGHEAGDEVLRVVAGVLRNAIRDVDVPARHGGEEFVVLLPETPLAAARDVAERIRTAVAGAHVAAGSAIIPVRISVGVSACPELVASPGELIASADGALYEAKRAGRDRVAVATPSARPGPGESHERFVRRR